MYELLKKIHPKVIVSALRGPFQDQIEAHYLIAKYAQATGTRVILLSSANVFDAFHYYPSYEHDKTLSESIYGKFKMQCEHILMRNLPIEQYTICRLPMAFGAGSPRLTEIKNNILLHQPIEVFPNLIMNTISSNKLSQQLHYIINRKLCGIFHLGSKDLIHHKEFVQELIKAFDLPQKAILKNVFTSNFDRYLAVLPRDNKLPKHLHITNEEVIQSSLKQ